MPADMPTALTSSSSSDVVTARPAQEWPRAVAVAALGVAVVAVGLAGWALLRPSSGSPAAESPSAQQVSGAKAQACASVVTVGTAVSLQTHVSLGQDPVAVQAVAANARLSMAAAGPYLLAHLDAATPPAVAAAIRSFAGNLQDIAMNTLAGVSNEDPAQAVRLSDAQQSSAQLAELCKS
jgi:hypothetical protein